MHTPSISPARSPAVRYVLRLADTGLILAQRLSEWCGHAPIIEEDIALTNMSLDLIGQTRALLTHAGWLGAAETGVAHDEDQLAFLRDERDYLNPTLVELPNAIPSGAHGPRDFALTVMRNAMVSTFQHLLWQRLQASSDTELAAIAAKAVKEARYHREHAGDWVVRLGDGTDESARRLQAALDELWRFVPEWFEDDDADAHAEATGLGPRWSSLREAWSAEMQVLFVEAGLKPPAERSFRSTGRRGIHSEHMGYLLAEMQTLQRSYPGGVW